MMETKVMGREYRPFYPRTINEKVTSRMFALLPTGLWSFKMFSYDLVRITGYVFGMRVMHK